MMDADEPVPVPSGRGPNSETMNVNFRVDRRMHAEFLETVHSQDRTSSQIIRDFMRDYIKKNKK